MDYQGRNGFFNWIFGDMPSGEAAAAVSIGDRFQHHGGRVSVWVVERISQVGASRFPLVSLAREGQPDLKKIVSIAVLQEGEDFTPTA